MTLLEAIKKRFDEGDWFERWDKRYNLCKYRYALILHLKIIIKKKQCISCKEEYRKLKWLFFQPFNKMEIEIDDNGNKRLGLTFKKE